MQDDIEIEIKLDDNNQEIEVENSEIIHVGEDNIIESISVNGEQQEVENKNVNILVPTKTSDIENDSNYVQDKNYIHTDNNYTNAEKQKLSELNNYDDTEVKLDISTIKAEQTTQNTNIANLQTNKANIEDIPTDLSELNDDSTHRVVTDTEKASWNNKSEFSGSYDDLTNKPSIPTKTSDITNDSGFIDKDVSNLENYYAKTATDNLLSNKVDKVEGKILSTNDFDNTYKGNVDSNTNARHTHSNKSVLDDISSTDITSWNAKYDKPNAGIPKTDLSSNVQTSLGKADTAIQEHQDISGKVDKVAGKSLSTEDYTTAEKEKLAGLENYDDSELVEQIEALETELEETQEELAETNLKLDRTRASLPKVSGEGEYVTLDGTSEDEFIEAPLPMGVTKQDSYTGSNLLVTTLKDKITKDGITLTPLADGRYKINGTANNLVEFWIQSYNYSTTEETLEANTTYYAKVFFEGTHNRGVLLNLWNGSSYEIETTETQANNGYAFTPTANITQKGFKITFPSGGSYTDCIVGAVIAKSNVDTYEPYVGGTASPNPDYPQEIKNVSGDVNVTVGNKNFAKTTDCELITTYRSIKSTNGYIEFETFTSGINVSFDLTGGVVTGQWEPSYSNATDYHLTPEDEGTYILKVWFDKLSGTGNNNCFITVFTNLRRITRVFTPQSTFKYIAQTITLQKGEHIKQIEYWNNGTNSAIQLKFYIQLEKGSTATSYVPHQQQTFTFPLSNGQKLMEGDYLAYDGVHHVRYSLVLNGTEAPWGISSYDINDLKCFAFTLANRYKKATSQWTTIGANSNYFRESNWGSIWNEKADKTSFGFNIDNNYTMLIKINKNIANTTQELKTWLASLYENDTPVIIEYPLNEEVIEPYTEAQQTAYNNIKKALSYKDQTNIYSTNEISPTFKVKAYADVSSEIDNLKTAIVALGGVV